jgi:hypothetical protein
MKVSEFKNTSFKKPVKNIDFSEFLDLLARNNFALEIQEAQQTGDVSKLLTKVPAFSLCGTFSFLRFGDQIQHSGLLSIKTTHPIKPIKSTNIKNDPYLYCSFKGIDGQMVYVFKINPHLHYSSYQGLKKYLSETYKASFSPDQGASILLTPLSYDDNYLLNERAVVFDRVLPSPPLTILPPNKKKDIDRLVHLVQEKKVDLTIDFSNWMKIAYGLASELGSEGEPYFLGFSQFKPSYNEIQVSEIYNIVLADVMSPGFIKTTSRAVITLAKTFGITVPKEKIEIEGVEGVEEMTHPEIIYEVLKRKYKIRYNLLTDAPEIDGRRVDKRTINDLWFYVLDKIRPQQIRKDEVEAVINSRLWPEFHPIREWFEKNEPWDEKDRMTDLASVLNLTEPEKVDFAKEFIFKWMIGVVNCLYGKPNPLILLIVSPQVGIGKTEFFRRLLPHELDPYWGEAELDNKDIYNTMSQNLIVYNDEFSASTKLEVEVLRKLTSSRIFSVTKKYQAEQSQIPRIASLCGSCNHTEVIKDTVDNRRYLVIEPPPKRFNFEIYNKIDKKQLWAQAYNYYQEGVPFEFLDDDVERLNHYSEEFKSRSKEIQFIVRFFEPYNPIYTPHTEELTPADITSYIQNQTGDKNLSYLEVGRALKTLGYVKKRIQKGNVRLAYYPIIKKGTQEPKNTSFWG